MPTAYSDKVDELSLREPLITKVRGMPSNPGPMPTKVNSGATGATPYIPTPSLDPRNVTLIDGYDAHKGYVQPALEAFSESHVGLQKLNDALEQVKKDPSKTPAQQILIVAREAEKLQDRLCRAMDSATKRLTDGIKSLDDSLSKPLTTAADNTVSAEVRKYVRDLPDDKRHEFMTAAMNKKDVKTLQAVLGAQGFLSGLSDEMSHHFTRQFHEQQTPEIAARLVVMRKALSLVEKRAPLILTEIPKCLGADWDIVGKLRKAQSAAEQALLLINNQPSASV